MMLKKHLTKQKVRYFPLKGVKNKNLTIPNYLLISFI